MKIPPIIYGTAWKEDSTTDLVKTAISQGFTAIDTANQPIHYQEPLVGKALQTALKEGSKRETLFIQTKFTPANSQGERIPYDRSADLTTQVKQSFSNSLKNLHVDYVDSYLLHGPSSGIGFRKSDWEVWRAIEEIFRSERAGKIGICNVNKRQLEILISKAEIKPMIVQNRCFAKQGWDREVRKFCSTHDIIYQGFSLLTANTFVLQDNKVNNIAKRLGVTPAQVIFRFASQIGMTPLTGTTNEHHMREDLDIFRFELTKDDLQVIEAIAG